MRMRRQTPAIIWKKFSMFVFSWLFGSQLEAEIQDATSLRVHHLALFLTLSLLYMQGQAVGLVVELFCEGWTRATTVHGNWS